MSFGITSLLPASIFPQALPSGSTPPDSLRPPATHGSETVSGGDGVDEREWHGPLRGKDPAKEDRRDVSRRWQPEGKAHVNPKLEEQRKEHAPFALSLEKTQRLQQHKTAWDVETHILHPGEVVVEPNALFSLGTFDARWFDV